MDIIKGATSESGTTVYYIMPKGTPVNAHADGRIWCGQCAAQKADQCRHAATIAAHVGADQRAARAARLLSRLGVS